MLGGAMRLIWTGEEPVSETRLALKARGYEPAHWGLPEQAVSRIDRRFPVLISRSGLFVPEAFSFLFDVALVRGSTRSARTLETYAESLVSWLKYAEDKGIQWRRPTVAMLATYRDSMLGTDAQGGRNIRPLSRRTINLRLTVAIEFYKHLGCIATNISSRTVSMRFDSREISCDWEPESRIRGREFQRLRVRIYSRRPKALQIEQCRALSQELRYPYRLMWQWALCTGLRTCSLIRIELQAFQALNQHPRWDQTIELISKGGKVVSVYVPAALIAATARYVAIDRVLVAARRGPTAPALFLNAHGGPVSGRSFYRASKRASARVKISVRPHQARTTFATYVRDKLEALNSAGANLDAVKVVQSLLAHADARTTEAYLESIDVPSLDVLRVLDVLARADVLSPEMT
jgi:integrase